MKTVIEHKTPRNRIAKEGGKLVMWYVPLILIGVFIGWLWAFIGLTILYLLTLAVIWGVVEGRHANSLNN